MSTRFLHYVKIMEITATKKNCIESSSFLCTLFVTENPMKRKVHHTHTMSLHKIKNIYFEYIHCVLCVTKRLSLTFLSMFHDHLMLK